MTRASRALRHETGYRHDIDGLRAVAVLLVVVYHVWLNRVSGGVDAFLMISAFFLTGSFVRRLEAGRPVAVVDQWVRTFKRLLPAASVVIAGTVVASLVVLPASGHPGLLHEAWASLFYFENWALAASSVDYYADTSLSSPLQHFWSLSVQGQVFLLWPLLFLLIAGVRRVLRVRDVRRIALVCFSLVFAGSLTYSIIVTSTRQETAYFDTGARLWEFAAGSILAIVLPWIRLPRTLSAVIGWVGIAALLTCGLVLDVQGGFPGFLALWPVLAVAAVILAGAPQDRGFGPAVLLERRPVLVLGRDAYALYLVHWPLLVLTLVARQGAPLSFLEGLALIAVSMVLARMLTWLVDGRIRRLAWANRNRGRGVLVILLSIALVATPVLTAQEAMSRQLEEVTAASAAEAAAANPGAAVLAADWNGVDTPDAPRRPLPQELGTQWGSLPDDCSDGSLLALPESIEVCFELEVAHPKRTLVVIGNSHAQQWLAPISDISARNDWHTVSLLYAACAFGIREVRADGGVFESAKCREWNEDVLELIERIDPDAVITIAATTVPTDPDGALDDGEREHVLDGAEESIDRLRELDIPVVLLRDNPRFTFDSYVCVEEESDPSDCSVERSRALAAENPADALVQPGVFTIDMNDLICPAGVCPAVIGNVNVYTDDNHLSTLYAQSMAPELEQRLVDVLRRSEPAWSAVG